MQATISQVAVAVFACAAILLSASAAHADDAGLKEPGGANAHDWWMQVSSFQHHQLSELPASIRARPSAADQCYFYLADPTYPHDFPDGGSD